MRAYSVFFFIIVSLNCGTKLDESQRYRTSGLACFGNKACFAKGDSILANSISEMDWKELSRADSLINFHDYSDLGVDATIFVLDYIEIEQEGKFLIRMGSDDGFQVFVNGEKVKSRSIARSVKPDSDWIEVNLSKGYNEIVFQVNQQDGGWGLYYQIEDKGISKELVEEYIPEIYRDLPEACILEDEARQLILKVDPRSRLDSYHRIEMKWIDPITKETLLSSNYPANTLPVEFALPKNAMFPLIFEYTLLDNQEVVYQESIPIFDSESVKSSLEQISIHKGIHSKWHKGLEVVFADELEKKKLKEFSTRLKAEYLWDVLNEIGEINYNIGGPRSEIFNGYLAKRYIPYQKKVEANKVLSLHVDFSDTVSNYFMSYPGGSHSLMTEWNSYAEYFDSELLFPFIVENKIELNTTRTISEYEAREKESFSVIAWSKGTITLLDALKEQPYQVKNAVIISPWVVNKPTESFIISKGISNYNKQVQWYWLRGNEDTDVLGSTVLDWVNLFEKQGLDVEYYQIPYSSHWTYFREPMKMFLNERN